VILSEQGVAQELGPGGAGWALPFTPRAYATELVPGGSTVDPAGRR
jgi:hypothetical protein